MKMPCPTTGHGAGTIYWRGLKDHCKQYEFDKIKPWLTITDRHVTIIPGTRP